MAKRKYKPEAAADEYAQTRLMSQFVWMVRLLMAEQRITKGELAKALNRPLNWVRDLLDGGLDDIDIRCMSDVMHALNRRLQVEFTPITPAPASGATNQET